MAGRIILDLPNPSLDGDGDPISGAQLTFYQAGTTTLGAIFSSRDLDEPGLENPATADAAGRFPDIWGDAVAFDVVWSDAGGAAIRTFTDIYPEADIEAIADDVAAAQAAAEAAEATLAAVISAAGNSPHYYPTTVAGLSKGVNSLASQVAGTGGTNGTFALGFTGGGGSGAAGVFTVAGGVIVATSITATGYNYATAPTVSFAASAGLTGASATAVIATNTDPGEYFLVPGTGDDFAILYENVAGVATERGRVKSGTYLASIMEQSAEYANSASLSAASASTSEENAAASAETAVLAASAAQMIATGNGFVHDLSGARMRYTYSATNLFVEVVPDVFLDPTDGNDLWDGLSGYYESGTRGPKQTRAGVEASAPMLANLANDTPCCIAIIAGDTAWRDGFDYYTASPRNGNQTRTYVSFVVYGGAMRKITCCDIIDKTDIIPHAVIANAYEVTVPHEMDTAGSTSYTSLFFNEERKLKQVANETDTATAGTWWAANGGLATPGVDLRIVMHLAANADPRIITDTIEYSARNAAWASQNNSLVQGLYAFGNGSNNGSIHVNNYSEVRLCLAEQGTKHNWLQGAAGRALDVIAVNCTRSDDVAPHASRNMFVCYAYDGGGTGFISGSNADLTRCAGIIDNSFLTVSDGGVGVGPGVASWLYCHAAGYIGNLTLTDCWDSGLGLGNAGEMYSATLKNYTSYSDFIANTGVMDLSGLGPLTLTGGFLFGSSTRPLSAYQLDIRGLVIVGSYTQVAYSTAVLAIRDSWLFSDGGGGGTIKVIDGGANAVSLRFSNNVIGTSYVPYSFTGVKPSVVADFNYYIRIIGGGGNSFSSFNSSPDVADFAAWKALGRDTYSQELDQSDTAAYNALFVSGARPTEVNLDPRLAPGTQASAKITVSFDDDGWQRAKALPRTRTAALEYLKTEAPAYLVATSAE